MLHLHCRGSSKGFVLVCVLTCFLFAFGISLVLGASHLFFGCHPSNHILIPLLNRRYHGVSLALALLSLTRSLFPAHA